MTEYCYSCDKRHDDTSWRLTNKGWICSIWFKPAKSLDSKIADMSPEEVLSGAQYGVKTDWGKPTSKKDWSKEHSQGMKELSDALK